MKAMGGNFGGVYHNSTAVLGGFNLRELHKTGGGKAVSFFDGHNKNVRIKYNDSS